VEPLIEIFLIFLMEQATYISFIIFESNYAAKICLSSPREEHTWRVFENRALKRIIGPKREEVTGVCGKLHSEGIHNLYCLYGIVTMIEPLI